MRSMLGLCAASMIAATLTVAGPVGVAAAEPTGCTSVNLLFGAFSDCAGGTGEHRVVAHCFQMSLDLQPPARGPWVPAGTQSWIFAGQSTGGRYTCAFPVAVIVETR